MSDIGSMPPKSFAPPQHPPPNWEAPWSPSSIGGNAKLNIWKSAGLRMMSMSVACCGGECVCCGWFVLINDGWSLKPGGNMPFGCHPRGKYSFVVPLCPLIMLCVGENCGPLPLLLLIICPNSVAMWFMVALLYGWSMHSTQLHVGPHSQTWSAGVPPLDTGLNFMTGKSGGGWNCCIGVKGADDIDSVLMWPLVMGGCVGVTDPDLTAGPPPPPPPPPPQQEDAGIAGAGAGTGTGIIDAELTGCEQHDAAAGTEQHPPGADTGAGTSRSTGSVVT